MAVKPASFTTPTTRIYKRPLPERPRGVVKNIVDSAYAKYVGRSWRISI
ncbi:MAG: hypothetical protein ABWK05_00845 [Pyrobaculum sp.]